MKKSSNSTARPPAPAKGKDRPETQAFTAGMKADRGQGQTGAAVRPDESSKPPRR